MGRLRLPADSPGSSEEDLSECCHCDCPHCGLGSAGARGRVFVCASAGCDFEAPDREEISAHKWEEHGDADEEIYPSNVKKKRKRREAEFSFSFDLSEWRLEDLPLKPCEVVLPRKRRKLQSPGGCWVPNAEGNGWEWVEQEDREGGSFKNDDWESSRTSPSLKEVKEGDAESVQDKEQDAAAREAGVGDWDDQGHESDEWPLPEEDLPDVPEAPPDEENETTEKVIEENEAGERVGNETGDGLLFCGEESCGYQTKVQDRLERHIKQQHSSSRDPEPVPRLKQPKEPRYKKTVVAKSWGSGVAGLTGEKANPHLWPNIRKIIRGTREYDEAAAGGMELNPSRRIIFACRQCELRTQDQQKIERHVSSVHLPDERPHQCDVCGRAFGLHRNMAMHKRQTHTDGRGVRELLCSECGARLASLKALDRHSELHQSRLRCCMKGCGFLTREGEGGGGAIVDLREHVRERHERDPINVAVDAKVLEDMDEEIFRCMECSFASESRLKVSVHVSREHYSETPYSCCLCPRLVFGHTHLLYRHLIMEHSLAKPQLAPIPENALKLSTEVLQKRAPPKMVGQSTPRPFNIKRGPERALCEQCGYSSKNKKDMERHISTYHGSFMCDKCDFTTSSTHKLATHVRFRHREICPDCKFPKIVSWQKYNPDDRIPHECPAKLGPGEIDPAILPLIIERGSGDYKNRLLRKLTTGDCVCIVCGLVTKMKETMNKHCIMMHSDWKCDLCDYKTTLRAAFLKHKKYKHDLKCDVCGLETRSEDQLRQHFCDPSAKHDEHQLPALNHSAQVKCPHCDFVPTNPRSLRTHIANVHSKETFKCDICGKVVTTKFGLNEHRKRVHSGITPFSCSEPGCNFSSAYIAGLRKHMAAHARSSDRNESFTCPEESCGYVTGTRGDMKRHRRETHPETLTEEQRERLEEKRRAARMVAEQEKAAVAAKV